jgi:hypothetical protein
VGKAALFFVLANKAFDNTNTHSSVDVSVAYGMVLLVVISLNQLGLLVGTLFFQLLSKRVGQTRELGLFGSFITVTRVNRHHFLFFQEKLLLKIIFFNQGDTAPFGIYLHIFKSR